jgi:uncharacterized membrane protein
MSELRETFSEPELRRAGITDNVAAGIAYLTIIPAVILLIVGPFRRNPYVRFHAWQSIFFFIFVTVIYIGLGALLGAVPITAIPLITVWRLLDLAFFVVWLVAFIGAFNGKRIKLTVIGALAETQANR